MENMEKLWDLLTFLAVLLAPSVAVITYFLFYRPIHACQDFMYGKYSVHWTCVGASLAGCLLGPITLLWPSEFMRTGTTWLLGAAVAFLIAVPLVATVHLPVLHYNRSCSVYQYLEDRFRSKFLRYFAFSFNMLSGLLFCVGILTLSAELAQQSLRTTVAEGYARRWVCVLVLSTLTGTAAALGGQKAAIFLSSFTLFIEFIVALICAVAMALYKRQTSFHASGMEDDSRDNGGDEYGNHTVSGGDTDRGEGDWFPSLLAPDYRLSSSSDGADQQNVWLTSAACLLYFFYVLGCQQTAHQHYCSVPTKRRARFALLSTVAVFLIVWSLTFILACLMINFYADPGRLWRDCFSSAQSSSSFSLLADPYSSLKGFFALTWASANGASGYFLGCFTCVCAFCSLPFAFVSLATSAYEDLVKPYYCINAEETRQMLALKTLTVAFASLTTVGALLLSELLLFEIDDRGGGGGGQFWWMYTKNVCLTLAAWTAPFAALYVLAIWLPCTNGRGAIAGLACGLALALTLCFLHLSQLPFDSHVQQPNSFLFSCCDDTASLHSVRRNRALTDGEVSNYTGGIIHGMSTKNSTVTSDAEQWTMRAFNGPIVSIPANSSRNPVSCLGYDFLRNASQYKTTVNIGYRLSLPLQTVITFFATIFVGLAVSLVTGRQDIYALDWNLVYWTCNSLDGFQLPSCFSRGTASSLDGHGKTGAKQQAIADVGGGKKKRRQRGPYTTSESFRYSKQGPFPDTSYLNPKVQDYMATLTRTHT